MAPDLSFFPYPHVTPTGRHAGLTVEWPQTCADCRHRECEDSIQPGMAVCRFGVNYVRVDSSLLIAGILIRDVVSPDSSRRRRELKRAGKSSVSEIEVETVIARYHSAVARESAERERLLATEVAAVRRSPEFCQQSAELLRPDFQRIFGQVHDYRQFVAQIIQNLNVILESRRPRYLQGSRPRDLLEHASHEEEAIYWAARLMEQKLDVSLYLLNPDRIVAAPVSTFRIHGLVLKYIRTYQRSFDQKEVRLMTAGESFGQVTSNPDAVGVIPHTFLDNALKYAPRGTKVVVEFRESESTIALLVSGYGPRLRSGEAERIFESFYRGTEATRVEPEGMGLGLGLASLIASRLGLKLSVSQRPSQTYNEMVWTTFTAEFSRGGV